MRGKEIFLWKRHFAIWKRYKSQSHGKRGGFFPSRIEKAAIAKEYISKASQVVWIPCHSHLPSKHTYVCTYVCMYERTHTHIYLPSYQLALAFKGLKISKIITTIIIPPLQVIGSRDNGLFFGNISVYICVCVRVFVKCYVCGCS